MYKFVYGFLLVIVLGSSGCSDWLDVQPKTSVPEEDLFADEFGFQDALTGFYLKMGESFDTVTVLQPTSPLRTAQDICNAYEIFCDRKADSVISVCEAEHSPLWCNTLPQDKCMNDFLPKYANAPRQGLDMYYRLNGAIYMVNVNVVLQKGEIYGEKSYAYIMEQKHSIDIDEELDFKIAELLVKGC